MEEFKVTVLATYNEKYIVDNILKSGAQGYVLKRSIAPDLLLPVDKVLGGERYVSPKIISE